MNGMIGSGRLRLPAALLALLVLMAAGCGGEQDPQRNTAQWVLQTGGRLEVVVDGEEQTVTSRSELPDGPLSVTRVGWADYPAEEFPDVTDESLERLIAFDRLTQLDLSGTAVTDAGLARLAEFENLTHLYLNETAVTDAGIEHLAALKNLTELGLVDTAVTQEGVEQLRGTFPRLSIYR